MCIYCEKYKQIGHNYCRRCGNHLTKGQVQSVRIPTVYNTTEKFCGYCGKLRANCKC